MIATMLLTDCMYDYEDVPSSLDYFNLIKIEIEEITFSVDPIIKEDTEEGKGLVDVKSGNIYFDHGQIYQNKSKNFSKHRRIYYF